MLSTIYFLEEDHYLQADIDFTIHLYVFKKDSERSK